MLDDNGDEYYIDVDEFLNYLQVNIDDVDIENETDDDYTISDESDEETEDNNDEEESNSVGPIFNTVKYEILTNLLSAVISEPEINTKLKDRDFGFKIAFNTLYRNKIIKKNEL